MPKYGLILIFISIVIDEGLVILTRFTRLIYGVGGVF